MMSPEERTTLVAQIQDVRKVCHCLYIAVEEPVARVEALLTNVSRLLAPVNPRELEDRHTIIAQAELALNQLGVNRAGSALHAQLMPVLLLARSTCLPGLS